MRKKDKWLQIRIDKPFKVKAETVAIHHRRTMSSVIRVLIEDEYERIKKNGPDL